MEIISLITFTDGGARGNPGPAALGVVIKNHDGRTIEQYGRYLGETTNNQAEYRALLSALEKCAELGAAEVQCFLDSELLVKQMNREYRVRDPNLAPLFVKIWNITTRFKKISFTHVRREKNKEADMMVNEALDRHLEESK
ncbi:MAG: ribonuclease H, putative phosphoglycerate mutase [Candidatus Magasanikbacteria bacterium]|nr:ribonuclease H, putative phosphoglycerate mutase [Candidatus Magasanikbacteria bacterium]